MTRSTKVVLCVCMVLEVTSTACTIRYSQTLVERIVRVESRPAQNADSGIEVGFGLPGFGSPSTIAFSEPMAVNELMSMPCEVAFSSVDYRAIYYSYYVAVKIPEVKTTSYCLPPAPAAPAVTPTPETPATPP